MSEIAAVADFPMVEEIERHAENESVFRVSIDIDAHGIWFRTLLEDNTNYRILTRARNAPLYWITNDDDIS